MNNNSNQGNPRNSNGIKEGAVNIYGASGLNIQKLDQAKINSSVEYNIIIGRTDLIWSRPCNKPNQS